MRGVEEVSAAIVEHGAPTCGWRRHAESEKAHSGFGENGSCHADRCLHDHGLNNVGENVTEDDAQVAGAESACGLDEFAFARREGLASNQACVADPASERER